MPKDGLALVQKMKAWDEDMVQRKSKAYDDVENFPNKFTANYLFLINHNESEYSAHPAYPNPASGRAEARGRELLDKELPGMNQRFWELGVGAVWKE